MNKRDRGQDFEGARLKTAVKKSSDERQWRSALGLQEVENAMLPTISESKAYPRMSIKYVQVWCCTGW